MKLHLTILLTLLTSSSSNSYSIFPEESYYERNYYMDLIKDCALLYTLSMGSLIAHEYGHALTAHAFWKSPLDITIGAQPDETETKADKLPLSPLPGVRFKSFNPFAGGFASMQYPADHTSEKFLYQNILVSAAGPLTALAFIGLVYKICDFRNFDLEYALNVHKTLILQQLYQFSLVAEQKGFNSRSKSKSDGEHIYDDLCTLWKKRSQKAKRA